MIFKFVALNENYAKEMIYNWKYEGEYSIYDYINEEEDLQEKENWGVRKFAVLNGNEELVGELTTEFFREVDKDSEDDGYIDIKTFNNNPDEVYEMWIGFGLRPDLTGKGIGKEFVSNCINFALKFHNYRGDYLRLGVAEFNKRAIKTYEKVGFEEFDIYNGEIGDKNLKILWMKKRL
jgi:ribosomal-protein-alanine N-acetyltransferase